MRSVRGSPMLPQAVARRPACASRCAVSAVVVLFPFVPVMPIRIPCRNHEASSTSATTRTPLSLASAIGSMVSGTPGLTATRSAEVKLVTSCPPSSSLAPARPRVPTSAPRFSSGLRSVRTTDAWRDTRKRAIATPLFDAPTTTTRLPARRGGVGGLGSALIASLSEFEGGQPDKRKDDGDDPKTDHDLLLRPARELEVVVDRRHPENPLTSQPERCNLEDHRQRLHDEQPADEDQEDLLLDHDGDGPESGPDRHRTDVPKKRPGTVPAAGIGRPLLEERKRKLRRVAPRVGEPQEPQAEHERHGDLKSHLLSESQPEGPLPGDLEVVVGEADDPVEEHGYENHPHKGIGEICPEKGGEHHRDQDEEPPHGGCTFLGLVGKRSLGSDLLPNLELAQSSDQTGSEGQADQKGGQSCQRRPEGDVPDDVHDLDGGIQVEEQMEEHQAGPPAWPAPPGASSPSCRSRARTTRSIFMPRDPFTRTRSPGRTSEATKAAAVSASGKCRTSTPPAARAASAARRLRGPTAMNRSMPASAACVPRRACALRS